MRTFHDEVLAYFLSQMWYDLIFVHVLRLRPRPFCCPEVDSKAEAVLLKQVLQRCADGQQIIKCHHINRRLWAVVPVLLLLFGVIEVWWLQRKIVPRHPHAATTLRLMLGTSLGSHPNPNPNPNPNPKTHPHPHPNLTLTLLLGMSLGWAFGHLCVYFVLDDSPVLQWVCGEEASELQRALCLFLRPGFAVLFTLCSACVITLSLACSHRGAARGGVADLCARRCPPWAWELLCALGRLFRAALGTMIMVLN